MKEISILTKFAEDKIREFKFEKANQALIKAIKVDPKNLSTYIKLGDLNYLMNKPNNSLKCYLCNIHLQINKLRKMDNITFSTMLDIKYNKLSDDQKSLLPSKYGMVIFEETLVPSHLAHSIVDLNSNGNLDPILAECSSLYREHLLTGQTSKELIDLFNICHEDYLEFEQNHYVSLGREYLIENIKWDEIERADVVNIYFAK